YTIKIYCPNVISGYGGAENYALLLAAYLFNNYKNIEITIVTKAVIEEEAILDKDKILQDFNKKYSLQLPDNLRFIILPENDNASIISKFIAHNKLRRTSKDADLFINAFHNVHFFYGKKNVHVIHFPAAPRVQASPFFTKYKFLMPIAKLLDTRYRACYDLFICNSAFTKKWLIHYWTISENRIEILYPPILTQDKYKKEQNRRDKDKIDKKEKIILIISRFDPRKKIIELVDFFIENSALFQEWQLAIAGSVDKRYRSYIEEIEKKAIGHRIVLYKNIEPIDLVCLYQKASIFWHAMGLNVDEEKNAIDVEHFGMTTVEAMSAGVVPIVINKGGQKEIVDHGINGFKWNNLEELRAYTCTVMQDKTLQQSLALAAMEKSKTFSRESFYQHADEIFKRHHLIPEEYRR
ncbi:MAG TPA: glycosyltransferase family 4 protein, partial [Rectinema sp.]|nr:glycosyltransferase family 4 protein [Rectinema sp.]